MNSGFSRFLVALDRFILSFQGYPKRERWYCPNSTCYQYGGVTLDVLDRSAPECANCHYSMYQKGG